MAQGYPRACVSTNTTLPCPLRKTHLCSYCQRDGLSLNPCCVCEMECCEKCVIFNQKPVCRSCASEIVEQLRISKKRKMQKTKLKYRMLKRDVQLIRSSINTHSS